jgi:hypothetical protein
MASCEASPQQPDGLIIGSRSFSCIRLQVSRARPVRDGRVRPRGERD